VESSRKEKLSQRTQWLPVVRRRKKSRDDFRPALWHWKSHDIKGKLWQAGTAEVQETINPFFLSSLQLTHLDVYSFSFHA
jgi:hypothetical protein